MTTNGSTNGSGRLAIELAPGAEDNAFATMLADLVRQNLESKPHKRKDFDALDGKVALIADDADVALTLEFTAPRFPTRSGGLGGERPASGGGRLTLHDGIKGVPDVAVRGSADAIMALSNVPLLRPFGLPLPTDRPSLDVLRGMVRASFTGELRIYGMFGNILLLSRLTRVMSVNG
ncbi:MAG: hypothetical protein KF850_11650 [Labilithrix sp.]|nr:hypothetical protein [Labilithrix sp.]MBX3212680.1 hypothetical protein [Labilithrix sp.]